MRCFTASLLFALFCAVGFTRAADEPAAGQFITLELVVADAPEGTPVTPTAAAVLELEKAGKLTGFSRYRLTALENQQSSVQFAELASLMSGRQQGFRGGEGGMPVFNQMSVGTMFTAVSRVEADGSIVSDLKFERSQVTPRRQPEGGDPAAFTPQGTATVNVRTTVRAKSGEPLLVGGRQHGSGKDAAQTWLVLTASVAPRAAGEKPKAAAAAGPEEELKIVQLKHASAPALAAVLTSVFQREFRIAVDERTNSLLLRGSPERLVIAQALIARLDES